MVSYHGNSKVTKTGMYAHMHTLVFQVILSYTVSLKKAWTT